MSHLSQFLQNMALAGFVFLFLSLFLREQRSSPHRTKANHCYDLAWWITITTQDPNHEYCFGPFETEGDAQAHQNGFIEDLSEEGATVISAEISWRQPNSITSKLSHALQGTDASS